MNETRRRRRDFIQNIAIAMLSVLAVLLFFQTQRLTQTSGEGSLFKPTAGTDTPISSAPIGQDVPLTLPVRTAVTGSYGRYGSVTTTTADGDFEPLRGLLELALNSARTPTLCSLQVFQEALDAPSVYCDFLSPLPLPVLTDALWASSVHTQQARCLLLSGQDGRVTLYLWDGAALCYRCDTDLPYETLETTGNRDESGNTHFAFDLPEADSLAPFSLLPDAVPVLPVLSVSPSLDDTNRLLTLLDFNPNTNYRYPESDGSETVVEGERSVRIRSNGTVVYDSGGEPALVIEAAGDRPAPLEAASGAAALLNSLLSGSSGEASLFLTGIRQSGITCTLTFDYQLGGVPIRFADGESAATVTLDGTVVSGMTLRFRQYTATASNSLLLPLTQTLAIAGRQEAQELSVAYADNGTDTAAALWLSE